MRNRGKIKKHLGIPILVLLLFCAFFLALCFGATSLSIQDVIKSIVSEDHSSVAYRIFFYVRLPRTLAAMLAGMGLSVSGVLIQGVLHNPLAGPNIIGVNAGAGFCALLVLTMIPTHPELVPFAAFIGAFLTCLCIYGIAAKTGAGKITIVLAGIAMSSILTAGIDTIRTIAPERSVDANTFFIGGFSGTNLKNLVPACYYILVALILAFLMARVLDILSLGEETAKGLGMNVAAVRFFLLMIAAVAAGASVSFAGLLGFVGLIVPHIARRFFGTEHQKLIPATALLGGSFVILCDLLSRLLFAPYEIPVGIVMSLLGGPFFIYLLLRQRKVDFFN